MEKTHDKQIIIHINRKKYEVPYETATGRTLKELASIPLTDTLFRQRPGEDEVITNDATVKLHNGDHFHSAPPADYGDDAKLEPKPKALHRQPDGWRFVIFDWSFGSGFLPATGEVLVKLPPLFPEAAPDMFWVRPALVTAGGGAPAASGIEVVMGQQWQRYSWHLKPGAWKPGVSTLGDFLRCIRERFLRGN